MSKNQSLLSLMPPEAQKQVLLLIKRLGDEKQAKQQAQKQCLQYEAEIIELKKQLEKLKKENITLKAKWQNSFSMISKVRENFSGSKGSCNDEEENGKKKLRFNKDQCKWQEESEQNEREMGDQVGKSNLSGQTNDRRVPNTKPLQVKNYSNQYFAIGSSPNQPTIPTIQTSRSQQATPPSQHIPHLSSKKPPLYPIFSQQSNQKNFTNSLSKSRQLNTTRSNKKLQIECLKQEIEQLTEEIKVKETGSLSLSDKIKKCEEIKNRYRKGSLTGSGSQGELVQENHSSVTVMKSYQSPMKVSSPINDSYQNNQQSFIKELSSNQKQSSFPQPYLNSAQKSSQNHQYLKENIRMNSHLDPSIKNNSFVHNNNSVHETSGYYGGNNNSTNHQLGNSSLIKKTGNKIVQPQTSFYDDGLLDLIADLNP